MGGEISTAVHEAETLGTVRLKPCFERLTHIMRMIPLSIKLMFLFGLFGIVFFMNGRRSSNCFELLSTARICVDELIPRVLALQLTTRRQRDRRWPLPTPCTSQSSP
jgi:hypothetical protein